MIAPAVILKEHAQGLSGITLEAGLLLGFAALFFLIDAWRFRYE